MDRKIYALVDATLHLPGPRSREAVEEGLEATFHAHADHAATFEDVQIDRFIWPAAGNDSVRAKVRVIIVADDELELQAIMAECDYTFRLDEAALKSELTGWEVIDAK